MPRRNSPIVFLCLSLFLCQVVDGSPDRENETVKSFELVDVQGSDTSYGVTMTGTELLVRIARELPNRFCSVLISNSITRINTRISVREDERKKEKKKEYPSMEETRRW